MQKLVLSGPLATIFGICLLFGVRAFAGLTCRETFAMAIPYHTGIGVLVETHEGQLEMVLGPDLSNHDILTDKVSGRASKILWAGEFEFNKISGKFARFNETSGSYNPKSHGYYDFTGKTLHADLSLAHLRDYLEANYPNMVPKNLPFLPFVNIETSHLNPILNEEPQFRHNLRSEMGSIRLAAEYIEMLPTSADTKKQDYWETIDRHLIHTRRLLNIAYDLAEETDLSREIEQLSNFLVLKVRHREASGAVRIIDEIVAELDAKSQQGPFVFF